MGAVAIAQGIHSAMDVTKELCPGVMHALGVHGEHGLRGVDKTEAEPDADDPEPARGTSAWAASVH